MFGDNEDDHIDVRPLLRLGAWGGCAVIALGAAVVAGRSEIGERRAGMALAAITSAPAKQLSRTSNAQLIARVTDAEGEAQRLSETVRLLADDRERLAARIAALERNLDDLTGSISRVSAASSESIASPVASPSPANILIGGKEDAAETSPAPAVAAAPAPPQSDPPAPEDTPPVVKMGVNRPSFGVPADVPLPRPGPLASIRSYMTATPAGSARPANRETTGP